MSRMETDLAMSLANLQTSRLLRFGFAEATATNLAVLTALFSFNVFQKRFYMFYMVESTYQNICFHKNYISPARNIQKQKTAA